jgi:hypothetical protein
MTDDRGTRKARGAWYTPDHLVDAVVRAVIDDRFVAERASRPIRIIDPACGDGRFLRAAIDAVHRLGGTAEGVGIDIDPDAVRAAGASCGADAEVELADALDSPHLSELATSFDVVVGNPPYLSQMAAATARGHASIRGGGPYADVAVEFLSLATDLVRPDGGRIGFVLPQSILAVRDAEEVRARIDRLATMIWSSWSGERDFDAQVVTCAVAFEFGRSRAAASAARGHSWTSVITERTGVPPVPDGLATPGAAGCLGERVRLNANFRDEYYGMIDAVGDHESGPPLITSGLIDPGVCRWGRRSVRFAKRRHLAPRLDVSRLDDKMTEWARRRLVPKVLIANQTPIVEAVCDPDGTWLPAVPVVAAYPLDAATDVATAWEVAAVLTAPSVSVWAWHQRGGTGLSADTIRLGPTMLAELPWPAGSLDDAVAALQAGRVEECGGLVDDAYGIDPDERRALSAWWNPIHERVAGRPD